MISPLRTTLPVLVCIAIGSASAGCGVNKDLYRRDMDRLKSQIRTLEGEKDDYIGRVNAFKARLQALGAEKGNLSSDLQAALLKIQELKEIARKRRQVLQNLIASFQSMVKAGKLKVRIIRGQLVVQLSEKILFDVGKAKLKTEGEDALRQLTRILVSLVGRNWQVAGHTDNTGLPKFNWKLSLDRSLVVVSFMIENGMPSERISAAGFGQYQPTASNDDDTGKQLNRRIEVILVPNLEQIMPKLQ